LDSACRDSGKMAFAAKNAATDKNPDLFEPNGVDPRFIYDPNFYFCVQGVTGSVSSSTSITNGCSSSVPGPESENPASASAGGGPAE
jgi:hypothetical protein